MDQDTRNKLQRATQQVRRILEDEFTEQLEGTFDVLPNGEILPHPGKHLDARQRLIRQKLVDAIEHAEAGGVTSQEAVEQYTRETSFTFLNRFVALRMLEARGMLQQCVSKGDDSSGFKEFCGLAPGLSSLDDGGYRLYLEALCDELTVEIKVLFDRRDSASLLWPRRGALTELLDILGQPDLASVWNENETIGWVYQYFNSGDERKKMREESQAPRNSRELAVRNQFFTPRYVVQFLTDNTLGRTWYEMRKGDTRLVDECAYLVRRPSEVFLDDPDRYFPDDCRPWVRKVRCGDFSELADDPSESELSAISLAFDGYETAKRLGVGEHDLLLWAHNKLKTLESADDLISSSLEPWLIMFATQREWRNLTASGPISEEFLTTWRRIYFIWKAAIQNNSDESQEALLNQTVYIPYRAIKDPRELKILDPACGSGHFLLYCFDLLQTIYLEAWEQGQCRADFGVRTKPHVLPDTVRFNLNATVRSNYSNTEIPQERAYVVIAESRDSGDGVLENKPYLVDENTTFRVPFVLRVPIQEFSYADALRDGLFTIEYGIDFLVDTGCFTFDGVPVLSENDAFENYRRQIPGLILSHNLHGIDIDPRCAQIAVLALWMRAQRAYSEQKIDRQQRPLITRSHIVIAEPMPGEAAFLEEFIDEHLGNDAEGRFLAALVRKIFVSMKLAGEAGALLEIEKDIAEEVARAKKQWLERPEYNQQSLFDKGPNDRQPDLALGISDEAFWGQAEGRIYDALRIYSEQAERSGGFQRRLFATDAARGFAFIDLCRQRYDIALMNPPFGGLPTAAAAYLEAEYPKTKNDIYSIFTEMILNRLKEDGCFGAITSRTGFYLKRFEYWRSELLTKCATPVAVADLGQGVLDSAAVETACYACFKSISKQVLFIKSDDTADRETRILQTIHESNVGRKSEKAFVLDPCSFRDFPECKWLYWIPQRIIECFVRLVSFKQHGFLACAGLQTNHDDRFVRLAWEVERGQIGHSKTWVDFYKGGEYSPFFDDIHLLVNWRDGGYEIKQHTISLGNSPSRHVVNENHYFEPGIGYINISSIGFSPQALPAGVVFSIQGQSIQGLDFRKYLPLLASSAVAEFLDIINPGRHYQAGQVQLLPIPDAAPSREVEAAALEAVALKQEQAAYLEETRNFVSPISNIAKHGEYTYKNIWELIRDSENAIRNALRKIDAEVNIAYGFDSQSREYINSKTANARSKRGSFLISSLTSGTETENEVKEWFTTSILSYLIGCAYGRWDIRYATGEREAPELPDPFDPLPVCPPGMLQNTNGLPATTLDLFETYRPRITWSGIIVDDDGHPDDIVARTRDALSVISIGDAPKIEHEACEILKIQNLRDYFKNKNGFFSDHIKRYSKSRRRAPIYWQLATPSASYSVWCYYHRFTKDTFFQVLNEYVRPKLNHESGKLDRLRGEAGAEPTRSQQKEVEDQEKFVAELNSMAEEVERIAPLWNPNLNDGVIINFAPLWRLVPQNKSWQKECKKVWDKLVKGEYDWAHLAMHLWPERVVPKCATDASLAIAHGLEEVFWIQDEKDRFQPKEEPQGGWDVVIKDLIEQRTSEAVKAALDSLLTAPTPASNTRIRRRKA